MPSKPRRGFVFIKAILFCLVFNHCFAVREKVPVLTAGANDSSFNSIRECEPVIPSGRIYSIVRLVEIALQQGYKIDDILVLLDIDETLITSFVRIQGQKIHLTATNIARYIFKQVLEKNIMRILNYLITQGLLQANSPQAKKLEEFLNISLRPHAVEIKNNVMLQLNEQGKLEFEAVERKTDFWINYLKERGIKFMGLTARGWQMRDITHRQLKSLGISFDQNTIHDIECAFEFGGFYNGILSLTMCSGVTTKGTLACNFFEHIGYNPKKIIYVDDNFAWGEEFRDCVSCQYPAASVVCIGYNRVGEFQVNDEIIKELIENCCGENWWLISHDFVKPFVIQAYQQVLESFWPVK